MTYSIVDESRFDGLTPAQAESQLAAEAAGAPLATVVVTWADLEASNDPETLEEIAALEVGERTVLGMCDPIERLT